MNRTIGRAIDRADEGNVASGYDLLRFGLRRARLRRLVSAPGGNEIVRLWEHACEIYCARYSVLVEERYSTSAPAGDA